MRNSSTASSFLRYTHFDDTVEVDHPEDIVRGTCTLTIIAKDRIDLLVHYLLHIRMTADEIAEEGDGGNSGIVSFEHAGVDFFLDVIHNEFLLLHLDDETIEKGQTFSFTIVAYLFLTERLNPFLNHLHRCEHLAS